MTVRNWPPAGGLGRPLGLRTQRRWRFACICLVAVIPLSVAAAHDDDAPPPSGPGYYGAIAYSPSTRAHGWAYDYASRQEAEERALARCGRFASDCIVPVWFHEACGALAVGVDGYGTGWGASRKLAEAYAVQSCQSYSGGCTVVRWVCTSK